MRASPARANSGGITGRSGKQNETCNACHNGGSAPTVGFDGPTQVQAGETVTLTFAVHAPNPAQRAAGFNVAAQNGGGTLAVVAGQGARLARGELTHSEPKNTDGNRNASWQFRWTAPPAPGTYRLFGAGNSVNKNGNSSGDRSRATTVDIEVVAALDTPTVTPTPTATPPPPTSTDTPSPTTTKPLPAGCAGDCDRDRQVAINELVIAVSIALGVQAPDGCLAADVDGDGAVSIAELIAAVNALLDGCEKKEPQMNTDKHG
ncbi:MAG: choice-of-anchor V domain-containing protein [Deltaproteobacteria bacterium]|nr:choice-of-anchor V domain-containing protein [Deltaproteobacteria bacterium]